MKWLGENCQVSERQARHYMQIAENWTAIEEKNAPGADLTIKGALRTRPPTQGPPRFTTAVNVYLDAGLIHQGHASVTAYANGSQTPGSD